MSSVAHERATTVDAMDVSSSSELALPASVPTPTKKAAGPKKTAAAKAAAASDNGEAAPVKPKPKPKAKAAGAAAANGDAGTSKPTPTKKRKREDGEEGGEAKAPAAKRSKAAAPKAAAAVVVAAASAPQEVADHLNELAADQPEADDDIIVTEEAPDEGGKSDKPRRKSSSDPSKVVFRGVQFGKRIGAPIVNLVHTTASKGKQDKVIAAARQSVSMAAGQMVKQGYIDYEKCQAHLTAEGVLAPGSRLLSTLETTAARIDSLAAVKRAATVTSKLFHDLGKSMNSSPYMASVLFSYDMIKNETRIVPSYHFGDAPILLERDSSNLLGINPSSLLAIDNAELEGYLKTASKDDEPVIQALRVELSGAYNQYPSLPVMGAYMGRRLAPARKEIEEKIKSLKAKAANGEEMTKKNVRMVDGIPVADLNAVAKEWDGSDAGWAVASRLFGTDPSETDPKKIVERIANRNPRDQFEKGKGKKKAVSDADESD